MKAISLFQISSIDSQLFHFFVKNWRMMNKPDLITP